MNIQKKARIHKFHDLVALSFTDTKQLYLEPQDARILARELIRFANECGDKCKWPTTRIVENGKATNESDGKSRCKYI